MSDKKQIEEMAKIIASSCYKSCLECNSEAIDGADCIAVRSAEALYNAGYRKQSEGDWIIVGEAKMTDEGVKIPVECPRCRIRRYIPNVAHHGYYYCPNCGARMRGVER